jgi:hypothetical protein
MEWSVSFQWGGSAVDGTKRGRPMSAETKVFLEACEKFMESSHRALRRRLHVSTMLKKIFQQHSDRLPSVNNTGCPKACCSCWKSSWYQGCPDVYCHKVHHQALKRPSPLFYKLGHCSIGFRPIRKSKTATTTSVELYLGSTIVQPSILINTRPPDR